MNQEYKKIKSSFAVRLKWTLLCGLVAGCITGFFFSSVFFMLMSDPSSFFFIWLRHPLNWPFGILTCVIATFFCTCAAATTVRVSKKETQIRQFFKTATYRNAKVTFHFKKKEKTVIVNFLKFLFFHCYMSVITETQEKKYHLFFFSEEEFTKAISEIKTAEMKNMPTEEKVELREELLEDMPERGLDIDTGLIRKKEKSRLLKTFCIYIGLIVVVFLLSQLGYTGLMIQLELLIAGLALVMAVFIFPLELVTYKRVANTCPDTIFYTGMGLWVGKDYYSFTQIQKLTMTSPMLNSKSILPVQRYMVIQSRDGNKKYWLGNAHILENDVYKAICHLMEEVMMFSPDKIVWSGKQSLLTK